MNHVKENFKNMLSQLGMTSYEFKMTSVLSPSTVDRLQSSEERDKSFSLKTIKKLVDFYNEHGHDLYPHHIDYETFRNEDIASHISPRWCNEQVKGDYVCYYLSQRGTGKPKAMLLRIVENDKKELNVIAIDTIHDLRKVEDILKNVLADNETEKCRKRYHEYYKLNYNSLRGSRFLEGKVLGCESMMSIILNNEHKTYEMRIATSLKSYLSTYEKAKEKYSCRGGAAISLITDEGDWPYCMLIGMIQTPYWHPDIMDEEEIKNALQRINDYQKKETMLYLQNDIDSLWYEVFMDAHRKSEANNE